MAKKENVFFESRDGITKIHVIKWIPVETPVCIFQIIHGMAEYADRYDEFGSFLADKGFLVVANDQLGHGQSVTNQSDLGYFCEKDPSTVVVRDVHRLKKMMQEENPGIPYIILGHSMGSYILRNYLCEYGNGIQGAIVMGTGSQSPLTIKFALALTIVYSKLKGSRYKSNFVNNLVMGAYNKKVENVKTLLDWLSRNEDNVKRYIADDKCGFIFTVNGFHTLFKLVEGSQNKKKLSKMPKNLPILMTSGAEDPIGNYGKGVAEVYNRYSEAGMTNVKLKMYQEDRHEIINEIDRMTIYEDIYKWALGVIK